MGKAMEYLMTYGWAILIIIVVVGALFTIGVFKPATEKPNCDSICAKYALNFDSIEFTKVYRYEDWCNCEFYYDCFLDGAVSYCNKEEIKLYKLQEVNNNETNN